MKNKFFEYEEYQIASWQEFDNFRSKSSECVYRGQGDVSGFGSVSSVPYTPSPCPKETMDFAAELRNRRIREIEERKNGAR